MVALNFIETYNIVKPLLFFVIGMSIYAVFVFNFYRFLAKKDLFELNLSKYNRANHWALKTVFGTIFYFLEYLLIMPVFIFFWFATLAFLLTFLAKNQTLDTILLVSIAVVGAVRVTCYYNEDLSKDLAKMLPFALLGVFLIDITYFRVADVFLIIKELPNHYTILWYYLGFIVFIELILRIFYLVSFLFVSSNSNQENKEE